MKDTLTTPEAVAVLCLLMVGADTEIKQEELASMLGNPFFQEHVSDKIGPHPKFVKTFNAAKQSIGSRELEKKAIAALNKGFPALKLKTLALMTTIAGADNEYDQLEKELVVRVATALKIPVEEIEPEFKKMKAAAVTQQLSTHQETSDDAPTSDNEEA